MKPHFNNPFQPLIFLLIKWSGVGITDGRGKAGGTVFASGRGGAFARNKVTPVNRRSPAQQVAKSLFAFFSQGFRALTASQINAWNSAATNGYTYTNIFGDTKHVSGINLYIGLNMNLQTVGVAAISNPPVQAGVSNAGSIAPSADVSASEVFVEGETVAGSTVVPANTAWVVLSSGPVSNGKNFVNSELTILAVHDAATDTATANLFTNYTDKYGALVAGQKVFFGLIAINKTTGQAGILQKGYAIVAA